MAEPDSRTAVVPMLSYEDPAAAIDWLALAFGFREQVEMRYTASNGTITHAQMEAGRGLIMLAAPTPASGSITAPTIAARSSAA